MRVSHQAQRLFQVFLDAPTEESYGFELAQASGLASGTIYPLLRRMEAERWITSRWEDVDESAAARRRRRYYKLTASGRRVALEATTKQAPALRQLVPGWAT